MGKNYLLEDGSTAKFNLKEFKTLVSRKIYNNRKNGTRATKEEIFYDIAEKYTLSAESVKRWFKGNGSPQDIEKIENLAEYFDISRDDLLIFDASDTITDLEKEQAKMAFDNNVYEEDPRLVITRNEIPVQAEVRWFVRDVYIDLYKYISDYLYYDQYVETDRTPENRQDPGYPLFYIRQKINQYRLDLPNEAVNQLNQLVDYLERIPFYKEIVDFGFDFDDEESYEETRERLEGYLNIEGYYNLLKEKNINPLSANDIERNRAIMFIDEFYKNMQQEFFKLAKELLGKYFE